MVDQTIKHRLLMRARSKKPIFVHAIPRSAAAILLASLALINLSSVSVIYDLLGLTLLSNIHRHRLTMKHPNL